MASPRSSSRSLSPDTRLRFARRLDWRFLLPDPQLKRVAYLGPQRKTLVESLELFSESLVILDVSGIEAAVSDQYDLTVAIQPSYKSLCRVAGTLKPASALYVEVVRKLGLRRLLRDLLAWMTNRSWRLGNPFDYLAVIERAGFTEAQLNWHWPNFESCTKIIPLNDDGALDYAFLQGGQSQRARLRAILGRQLKRSGLLFWIIPCFSIVAPRRAD
jgi:hypothetical protein